MDALVKFPTRSSCQGINSDITKRVALRFSSSNKTCNLHLGKTMHIQQPGFCFKKNALKKSWDDHRISAIPSKEGPKSWQNSFSPAEIVDQFYTCINEKKLQQLSKYISEDACFDYYTFAKPFQGKKEVMHILEQVTASMGQNVKFRVGHICEGDDFTAAAYWHLEFKKEQIPFTRGCSFFELSKEGDNMIIRRADVLIESPVKPGSIVLTLLKTVTLLFDNYPNATAWFLGSPLAGLKWILKIYIILAEPFLNTLLGGYIKLWNFMIRWLSYALNVVIFISKILFM